MDYFFVTADAVLDHKGVMDMIGAEDSDEARQRLQELVDTGEVLKCLIVADYHSKSVFVTVVPQKGLDPEGYSVEYVVEAVKWLGYTRLILKSDNEPAMLAVVRAAVRNLRVQVEEIKSEQSIPYDSRSHGGTESRIKSVRGLFRTLRSCLEARLGKRLPIWHPATAWMLAHTGELLNIKLQGHDGRAPWARVKGRNFNRRLAGFGELCMYKVPSGGPEVRNRGNCEDRHLKGTFLGIDRVTSEYILATEQGVAKSRSLMRLPFDQRWREDHLSTIVATPWQRHIPRETEAFFPERCAQEAPPREEVVTVRRFKITAPLLEQHGLSEGCPQCDWIRDTGQHRPGMQHTDACRARIRDAFGADT
jgi:hypothetical protein